MVRTRHLHIFLGRNSRWLSLEQRVCNKQSFNCGCLGVCIVLKSSIQNLPKFQKEKMKTCVFKSFFRGNLSKFRNKNSDQQHVLRHLPRAYQKTSSFEGIFSDLVISSMLCVFRKKGVCLARMNKRLEVSGSGLLLGLQGWLVPFCLTPNHLLTCHLTK